MNVYEFLPRREWSPAPPAFRPARYSTVFPPVQKAADGRLIIDQNRKADGSYEVVMFDNRDHPAIERLPPHAPRAVKQILRREWRLRFLRSTDCWSTGADIRRAEDALQAFEQAAGPVAVD